MTKQQLARKQLGLNSRPKADIRAELEAATIRYNMRLAAQSTLTERDIAA